MTALDTAGGTEGRLVMLEARNVTKQFKGFVAVNDVNLRVHEGTIHALIGPNGAGKSTMFNLLTKFLEPTSGQILYEGRDITRLTPAVVAQQGLVRSFQISAVFPHLSVLENVRVALQRALTTGFHFWRSERSLGKLHPRAMELIEAVNLEKYAQRLASELPYGRKRALEIATTLALEPKVMLLDEPLAGMGHEDIEHTAALIRRVAKGRTVLMVEHNLSVVAHLSDVITVLRRGEVLAEGPYDTISRNPQVMEAYMGAAHA
jgi:branched-chain amino acid transport system ATP-binding protein